MHSAGSLSLEFNLLKNSVYDWEAASPCLHSVLNDRKAYCEQKESTELIQPPKQQQSTS